MGERAQTIDAWLSRLGAHEGRFASAGWAALAEARARERDGRREEARLYRARAIEFWRAAERQGEALTGQGLDGVRDAIEAAFEETLASVELLVPYSQGGALAELHEVAGDLERSDEPQGVLVKARVPRALAHRFTEFALNGSGSTGEPNGSR